MSIVPVDSSNGASGNSGCTIMKGKHTLAPEELPRDVQLLASHNNDLLTVKELLGDGGSQTSKEMSLAIDDNLSTRELSH